MDFDNDLTKLDLPNDTAYTTFQNIWSVIQEIQQRMRFHEIDLSGSPALPPVDRVDICLRASDSKLVALKPDGSIVDIENSAAVSDHGTKIKDNGTLISSAARPLNLPVNNPITFVEDAFNDHFTIDIAGDGIQDIHISAHTSTKITITNLAQLPSSLITETNTKTMTNKTLTSPTINTAVLDANRISTYLELTKLGGDPSGNPAADRMWLYVDASENLVFENDAGTKTIIGASPTFPITIGQGGTGQTTALAAFNALSPLTTNGDLLYNDGTNDTRLPIGTNGHILTVVSGVPAWAANAGGGGGGVGEMDYITQARERVGFIEDFFSITDRPNYTAVLTGTGAAITALDVADVGIFGVAQISTGTTTSGEIALVFGGGTGLHGFRLGQGITIFEGKIKVNTLSDGTNTYRFIFGFGDLSTDPSQTEGCWIEYEQTNSVNWRYSTGNDNTKTEQSSSTAVVAGSWVRLKVEVNAAASSVTFYVNGVSIGTTNTNLPNAAGDELFPIIGIFKSAGTTARTVDIDYAAFQIDLTTPR